LTAGNGTLIVTSDTDLADSIRGAIGEEPCLAPIGTVSSLLELTVRLSHRQVDLVLVDISPSPTDTLASLKDVTTEHADTRFVVIAPDFDKELLLLAMRAGARHFMPKSWVNEDMLPVCRDLVEQLQEHGRPAADVGDAITVFSSSGGCGATTVATSLAAELSRLAGRDTLVVDLDIRFGGVAAHLGLEAQYGIADVLARGDALDANLVDSIATHHDDGIDALLSPVSVNFEDPAGLHAENMHDAVRVFRSAYPSTVIDAPALVPDAAASLSRLSTHVLIVLQPSVKDLPIARALLGSLRSRAVTTPVTIVANRVRKRSEVSIADVKSALEIDDGPFVLPDDPKAALHALTEGKTLRGLAKSPLRRKLAGLAELVRTPDDEDEQEPQPVRRKGRPGRRKAARARTSTTSPRGRPVISSPASTRSCSARSIWRRRSGCPRRRSGGSARAAWRRCCARRARRSRARRRSAWSRR